MRLLEKMAHYKGAASEGNRAVNLLKKREKQKEELELLKKKIAEVSYRGMSLPDNRACANLLSSTGAW